MQTKTTETVEKYNEKAYEILNLLINTSYHEVNEILKVVKRKSKDCCTISEVPLHLKDSLEQ